MNKIPYVENIVFTVEYIIIMPVKQNTSIIHLKRYNQALHYGLIKDGTGEHYRKKSYKLDTIGPKLNI